MEGGDVAEPSSAAIPEFFQRRVAITDAGREVLHGHADRTALLGLDRWLGGVHLTSPDIAWRWDANAQRLTEG